MCVCESVCVMGAEGGGERERNRGTEAAASLSSPKLLPFFFSWSSQPRSLHLESSLQFYYLKIAQHISTTIKEMLEMEMSTLLLILRLVSVGKFNLASLRL